MHLQDIENVVDEIRDAAAERPLGSIYQLSAFTIVLDLRSREGLHLLISVDPRNPRIHLVVRKLRELEKSSLSPGPFVQTLRSLLRRAKTDRVVAHDTERIVTFEFSAESETGEMHDVKLLAQLTGRSANLFLLDELGVITHALRTPRGDGQLVGKKYEPPPVQAGSATLEPSIEKGSFNSLSAALDALNQEREAAELFDTRIQRVEQGLRQQIRQKQKLLHNLQDDLVGHGNPEEHKRLGDLLLANIATAERDGDKIRMRDLYSEGEPVIEVTLDKDLALQEHAAQAFNRYTKAKRAAEEISQRIKIVKKELEDLHRRASVLQQIKKSGDRNQLSELEPKAPAHPRRSKKDGEKIPGVRRYLSSDEYEILVGRAAQTNDQLTFKVAKPNDLWLHAADYPGSHVIVRNYGRKEIPHRTIIEAAQLAARFSQASKDTKVDVHYTKRKYLSKPKGAAPGLVRLSQFKTITVTPKEVVERLMK